MTTTSSKFFDEVAKLMTNAAGAAQGVRNELDTLVKSQVERVLGDLDVVQREEFEAVRAMAQKAREENETLSARIAELESKLTSPTKAPTPGKAPTRSKAPTPSKEKAKKSAAKKPTRKPAKKA
jgi:BMFP domain-containing protein YqiC